MDVPNAQNCYLETTGRVTGKPHTIEIWYASRDSTLYILSGGGDRSDWVKNLQKNPRIRVRIDNQTFTGTASVIAGTDEDLIARETVVAKYYGWTGGPLPNDWARESLPVAIRLDPAN
jgi:deazaflavin-dependent oxidoreductase (nitroreductase family)